MHNSTILENLVKAIEVISNKPAKRSGKGYRLPCPAHHGKDYNLYIGDGDKKLVIKCHSHQCDPKDIVESAGLTLSDIYYERLTGSKLNQHRIKASDLQIKKELEKELLVLMYWLNDIWREMWPINEDADPPRVALAIRRVHTATKHFIKEGVQ